MPCTRIGDDACVTWLDDSASKLASSGREPSRRERLNVPPATPELDLRPSAIAEAAIRPAASERGLRRSVPLSLSSADSTPHYMKQATY